MAKFKKLILALLILSLISPVFAQVQPEEKFTGLKLRAIDNNDFVYEYRVNPGDSIQGKFLAQHDFQDKELSRRYYVLASDFTVDPDSGSVVYPERSFYMNSPYSFAKYITFNKSMVNLQKFGDEELIEFSATIPTDLPAGTYFASLLMSNISAEEYKEGKQLAEINGANLASRLAPVVIVTVNGDLNTTAEISKLQILDIHGQEPWAGIHEYLPVTVKTTISNNGNYVINPGGNITIHQGEITAQTDIYPFNPYANRVLPGTARPYQAVWDGSLLNYRDLAYIPPVGYIGYVTPTPEKSGTLRIGRYFATAQVTYKDADGKLHLLNLTKEFWVLPWKLLLLLLLVIALIVYLVWRKRRSKAQGYTRGNKSKWLVH